MTAKNKIIDKLFRDDHGNIVIVQRPNLPLSLWIVSKLAGYLPLSDGLLDLASTLSTTFLAIWAFLELVKGVNIFRRLLGLTILVWTLLSIL